MLFSYILSTTLAQPAASKEQVTPCYASGHRVFVNHVNPPVPVTIDS